MKVPRKKNPIGQRVGGPHRDSSAQLCPRSGGVSQQEGSFEEGGSCWDSGRKGPALDTTCAGAEAATHTRPANSPPHPAPRNKGTRPGVTRSGAELGSEALFQQSLSFHHRLVPGFSASSAFVGRLFLCHLPGLAQKLPSCGSYQAGYCTSSYFSRLGKGACGSNCCLGRRKEGRRSVLEPRPACYTLTWRHLV